ncbi:uncharacterized protein F54H12.2 [Trichonephila clavipes]|nr:uncharacterized protein F54H12.2 [Trichonephila clavipes]
MTSNNTKASIVERFNRTLKTKNVEIFTEKNTKRYIGVVDKLVYSYNNTWHRSIQMTPASVTETNQSQVWENLYGYGIGGWFKRLFRTALPFLTRGAKSVGKEVLKTGTQIVNDLLEGQNLEDAAKHRTKETGRKLAREAIKKADDMLGQDSPECAKSELNLFTLPPTQTVIEKGQWIQFHPIANVTDGGPVEFLISGSGEDYLDLS